MEPKGRYSGRHTGRHAGEFLLLFLAEEDSYGGKLLQKCEEELPVNPMDSAIIYRTLKKLEEDGAVESYLDTSDQDKPIKMYRITGVGERILDDFKINVELKIENLYFFLNKYKQWKESEDD